MTFVFSPVSLHKLSSCDPRLQVLAKRALSYGVADFTVNEGYRSPEDQKKAFDAGKSQIDGISKKGNHNYDPSRAMDLLPYPFKSWDDIAGFNLIATLVLRAAGELGYKIGWGGHWPTFKDLPHFELLEE